MNTATDKKHRQTRARTYVVCGIPVRSEWEIPYSEQSNEANPRVDLAECSADELEDAIAEAENLTCLPAWYRIFHLESGSTLLHFPDLAYFLVSADGRLILGHPLTDTYRDGFFTYLLGHAFSYSLLQFGIEQLHAACVTLNDSAVAFLGDTGFGKSTLTAAFIAAGHQLVTDDLLVLQKADGVFNAQPGLSRIKLYPEAAEHFFGKNAGGTPLNAGTRKLVLPLASHQFHRASVKLAAFYAIARSSEGAVDEAPKINRLSKSDAFVELCKATFNPYIPGPARSQQQFSFASELADTVPVSSLSFPNGFGLLRAIRDAVAADLD
jgi:hypothetical protein